MPPNARDHPILGNIVSKALTTIVQFLLPFWLTFDTDLHLLIGLFQMGIFSKN